MRVLGRLTGALGLVLVVTISVSGADPARDRATAFVTQLYQQVLGRPGSGAEITGWAGAILAGVLTSDQVQAAIAGSAEAQARARALLCPATPGAAPDNDLARGRCLFHSNRAFGQDPSGPFASCASCHYGEARSDHAVHLVQITNAGGATIQVLRKTPSLLRARVNFPYGWDGRFPSVQAAARAAILSPVEMNGASVSADQLDALAAFVLALPDAEPPGPIAASAAAAASAQTLQNVAVGKTVFFGKGTCVGCHPAPTFTTNGIATDQVAFDFTGSTDPGAGFVGTGPAGSFKVPSLLFLEAERPFMHNGAMGTLGELVRFYDTSLGLGLTAGEKVGLEYWLRNCLDPRRGPQPATC